MSKSGPKPRCGITVRIGIRIFWITFENPFKISVTFEEAFQLNNTLSERSLKMRTKWFILLTALVVSVGFTCYGWAGGPENPPDTGSIGGPELWGVMIVDCGHNILTLRVKRIVDCNVQTQAFVDATYELGCPADETTPLYRRLGVTLFDINPNPAVMDPIITRVKNFKEETGQNIYSFDVQIKFWTP
jgi:hypothetical protein